MSPGETRREVSTGQDTFSAVRVTAMRTGAGSAWCRCPAARGWAESSWEGPPCAFRLGSMRVASGVFQLRRLPPRRALWRPGWHFESAWCNHPLSELTSDSGQKVFPE